MRLLLIRHPRPDVAEGTCYGRLDVPPQQAHLDETVQRLRARWRAEGRRPPAAVFSSPLQRCARLAQALAGDVWPGVRHDERIAEVSFGRWEGRPWAELPREELNAWRADIAGCRPPGGESLQDLAVRLLDFSAECLPRHGADPDAEYVLVTHVGVIQVLGRVLRNAPLSGFGATAVDYSSISTLVLRDGSFAFESYNEAP